MSFLTLFTADAAAAHGHEFSNNNNTNTTTSETANSPIRTSASSGSLGRSGSMGGGTQPRSTISSNVSTVFEDLVPAPSPAVLRKSPRTKTAYHLAQPPPSAHLLHRHSLKPSRNLVVQLQRLSNTTRPVPTLDVLPASIFASRLKATCGRFFKHGVGSQDLVFLTSEEYGSGDEDDDDVDEDGSNGLNARQVVATVSQNYKKVPLAAGEDGKGGSGGMARVPAIRLDSGPPWEVTQTAVGGYEFSAYQEDGSVVTARWNPRGVGTTTARRRSSSQTQSSNSEDSAAERKFQFTLVNPDSRRHPIIATLVKQTIEINDHYPAASLSSPVTTPTHSRSSSPVHDAPSSPISEERLYIKTSDYIRMLILASGIWVALREGLASSNGFPLNDAAPLSPTFSSTGHLSPSPATTAFPTAAANRPRTENRSSSYPAGPDISFDETPHSRLIRSGTTSAKHTPGSGDHHAQTPTPPRRSFSAGTPARPRSTTTSHILRSLSSTSRTPSPTPRADKTNPTTRPQTPPTPLHRVPDQPLTPPTSGCMRRPRRGAHHKHTNSVSLPGSPAKYPEEKRRRNSKKGRVNKDLALVDVHQEWRGRGDEAQGDGANGLAVENSGGVPGGKKKGED